MMRALCAAAAVLFAAGCAVGPNYRRPSAPVPSAFKELAPTPTPAAVAGQAEWKPATPRDEGLRGRWWEIFGDPELAALEEQVNVSNQNVARAEAVFRGARAAARGARADFFPTVGATASVTRSNSGAARSVSAGTTTQYQVSADLSWELDVFGRIRRNVESNVEAAQASAADLEAVRLALQAELAVDYFLLHGLDAQKQLLDSNVAAYQTALQLTINRFNQGIVSGVDVAQAQTQLETTRAQATDLSITRAQLEHAIAILTGKPPAELTIAAVPITVTPPAIPVALPSELLERRPDVAAAERRVAAANAGGSRYGAGRTARRSRSSSRCRTGSGRSVLLSWRRSSTAERGGPRKSRRRRRTMNRSRRIARACSPRFRRWKTTSPPSGSWTSKPASSPTRSQPPSDLSRSPETVTTAASPRTSRSSPPRARHSPTSARRSTS